MEALGILAGGIAHDFNNVLIIILATVQLVAQEDDLSEASRVDLEMVAGAADLYRDVAERMPDLPVIFVSGYGEEALRQIGDLPENGVFLQKPVEPGALRDAVARVTKLDPRRQSSGEQTEAHA